MAGKDKKSHEEEEEEIEGEEWEDGEYEIAYIMKDKVERGVHMFYVHWKGWSHFHDSWATRDELDNCDLVLAEYFKKKAADQGKKKAAGKKSRLAPSTSTKPSNRPNPRKEKPACKRSRTSGSSHSLEKERKKPRLRAYIESDSDDEGDKKPKLDDKYTPSRRQMNINKGRGRGTPASSRQSSVAASKSTASSSHRRSSRLSTATRSTRQPFPEAVVKRESAEQPKEKPEKKRRRSSGTAAKQQFEAPVKEEEAEKEMEVAVEVDQAAQLNNNVEPPDVQRNADVVDPAVNAPPPVIAQPPVVVPAGQNGTTGELEVITSSIRRRRELKAQQEERIKARERAKLAGQGTSRGVLFPPMGAHPNVQESRPQSASDIGPIPEADADPFPLLHKVEENDDLIITAEDVLYTDLFVHDESRVVDEPRIDDEPPVVSGVPEGPRRDRGDCIEEAQNLDDESDNDDDLVATEELPQLEDPKVSGFALGLKAEKEKGVAVEVDPAAELNNNVEPPDVQKNADVVDPAVQAPPPVIAQPPVVVPAGLNGTTGELEVITSSIRRRRELKAQQEERIKARERAKLAGHGTSRGVLLPPKGAHPNVQNSRPQSASDMGPIPEADADPLPLLYKVEENDDLTITAEDVLYTDLFVHDESRVVDEPRVEDEPPVESGVPEEPRRDRGDCIEEAQNVDEESDNDDDLVATEELPQLEDPKVSGFALGLKARILTLALNPGVSPEEVKTSPGAFAVVQFSNRKILEVLPIWQLIQRDPDIFNEYVARINAREKQLGMDVTKPTGFIKPLPENLDNW